MFWRKKPKPIKILRTRIDTISETPELGMLNIQTDQGPVRLLVDQRNAAELMEQCLALLGYPASMDQEPYAVTPQK